MSTYSEKQDRHLLIGHDKIYHGSTSHTISLQFIYIENDHPCNFSDSHVEEQGGGYLFDDLQISAQYDEGDPHNRKLYGWSTEYKGYSFVKLQQARDMVKTLNRVETGMKRLEKKWGYPDSFAAYVIRVASLFKASTVLIRKGKRSGGLYSDNNYQTYEITNVQWAIDKVLREGGKNVQD